METATAAEAKALLSALAAAAQEVLDRDETVRQELRELDSRLEEGRAAQRQARKALAKAVEERDAVQNVISGYALRLESRRKKAEQARERHMKLQMDENALSSRVKMLTEMEKLHEGYSKAVKLVMGEAQRGSLQHIHGPVADLLKVPEEYTVAIETALGGAMQNLVVDREEDGKAVIQYLKRRDAGRATILPLSSIRPGELREGQALRREPGFVGVGDQLISFQPQYRNVFSNLLGRVAVMEDLDHAIAAARKYGYKFRIVTLDGQVLNPGGSMTGGSASRSAGILSRANELERLNEQGRGLREQLAQAAKALEEADREAAAAGYEMETAQSQLREWEDAILKAEGEAAHCDSVVADLERQSSSQQEELEQLKSRSAQIESDTRGARSRIQELEGAAAALKSEAEGKVRGQTDLQDRSARITRELSELTASLAALEAEQETTAKSLGELKSLRDDMAGDREQNQALIGQYEEKNRQFTQEIGEKDSTPPGAAGGESGPQRGDPRPGRRKAGPGGTAQPGGQGQQGQERRAAGHGAGGLHTGAAEGGCRHGGEAAFGQAVGDLRAVPRGGQAAPGGDRVGAQGQPAHRGAEAGHLQPGLHKFGGHRGVSAGQ